MIVESHFPFLGDRFVCFFFLNAMFRSQILNYKFVNRNEMFLRISIDGDGMALSTHLLFKSDSIPVRSHMNVDVRVSCVSFHIGHWPLAIPNIFLN